MERLVNIEGDDLVIGLSWEGLANDKSKSSQISALTEQSSACAGVIRRGVSASQVGLSAKLSKGYSAAALLADSVPGGELIYIDELDDGGYWVCAISNGLVLAGGDLFTDDKEDLVDQVNEILSISELRIVCPNKDILSLFSYEDKGDSSYSELIAGEGKSKSKIKSLTQNSALIYILIAACVIALGGGGTFYYFQEEAAKEAAKETPAQVKTRLSKKAKGEFNKAVSKPSLKETVTHVINELSHIDLWQIGWRVSSITVTNGALILSWVNDGGNLENFYEARSAGGGLLSVDSKGVMATETIIIPIKTAGEVPSLSDLSPDLSLKQGLISYSQNFGGSWSIKETMPLITKAEIPAEVNFKSPISAFSYEIGQPTPISSLLSLSKDLDKLKTFRASQIDFKVGKNGINSWKLTGIFYDR